MTTLLAPANQLLARLLTPTTLQAGLLFGVDMLSNVADYAFHIMLAWALTPADFVTVQTISALLLTAITAFGVLQPVVARYVAGNEPGRDQAAQRRGIFQVYFRQAGAVGGVMFAVVLMAREPLAAWLGLPLPEFTLAASMLLLIWLRPVVAGMLQGRERFVPFGLTRTAYAVGRLLLAVLIIGWLDGGALAATLLFPLAALLSLLVGLAFLGRDVWRAGERPANSLIWAGWRLSFAALLAYGSYMLLLTVDLVWVNRLYADEPAATYATLVVLRRILAVLPGVVLVILFPRVVSRVKAGISPDRLLVKSALVIGGAGGLLTAAYFLLAAPIVRLAAGGAYPQAAPLLGWTGLAMLGFSLAAIWLNLFLATRPWPFVILLVAGLIGQIAALSLWSGSLAQVTAIFLVTGWLLAAGGLAIYLLWLRPALAAQRFS